MKAEEQERIERARGGDKRAIAELVNECSEGIRRMAYRYAMVNQMDADDLYQEGIAGMLFALRDRWDQKKADAKKATFSTYATWWARAFMFQEVFRARSVVKAPHATYNALFFTHGKQRDQMREQGMTHDEVDRALAKKHGMSVARIRAFVVLMSGDVYGDTPVSTNGGDANQTIFDRMSSAEETPEEQYARAEFKAKFKQQFDRAMARLNDSERLQIHRRFLKPKSEDERPTLEEVAKLRGVTRQRVQQIEQRAIEKLASALSDEWAA